MKQIYHVQHVDDNLCFHIYNICSEMFYTNKFIIFSNSYRLHICLTDKLLLILFTVKLYFCAFCIFIKDMFIYT